MTYDITGDAKNVIRASFDVYYSKPITTTFWAVLPDREDQYKHTLIVPRSYCDGLDFNNDQTLIDLMDLVTQPQNLSSVNTYSVPATVDPDFKQPITLQ